MTPDAALMQLPDGVPILPPDVIAPEKQILRYISHPKLYSIPAEAKPIADSHEGLFFRESHEVESHPDLPGNVGRYRITIEGSIGSSGEFLSVGSKIRSVAEDLDKFWAYACGEPLNPIQIQLLFQVTHQGWESNEESVKQYLVASCRKPFAVVQLGEKKDWISISHFPLMPALVARDKYQKADPPTQALIDIHYSALKARQGEGKLFLFAKALELAKRLLPGSTNLEKQNSLHPKIQTWLNQSLDWLFNIANNRYDVRHVVKNPQGPTLHPKMTGKEMSDFEHDADLVIKSVVFQGLDLNWPPPYLRQLEDEIKKDKSEIPMTEFQKQGLFIIGGVSIEMS